MIVANDKLNAYLFKPRRRRGGKLRISKFWHCKYRLAGAEKYRSKNLRVRDQQVAQQRMNEFVRELEREAAGVVVPRALREAAGKSMTDHLVEFIADLKARRRSKMYAHNVEKRAAKLIDACEWKQPRDVTADSFTSWRAGQTGKAAKTLNDYLDVAWGLLNWMARCGRLVANPLRGVGKVETAGKEARIRRALTIEEVGRLLAVAGERRTLYLAALLTGLRRGELLALRWGDVHLDALKPFLSVRASTTKNGKPATMWLRDDLADSLRRDRPAGVSNLGRVFPKLRRSMDDFKADLAAAKILFKVDGRQADFHSLRHTLATILAQLNVAPRVAMEIMRHSDLRLTMRTYTDANLLPTAEALERFPRFEDGESVALAATGTEGGGSDTQNDTQNLVRRCPTMSSDGTGSEVRIGENHSVNEGDCEALAVAVQSCPEQSENWGTRIRT